MTIYIQTRNLKQGGTKLACSPSNSPNSCWIAQENTIRRLGKDIQKFLWLRCPKFYSYELQNKILYDKIGQLLQPLGASGAASDFPSSFYDSIHSLLFFQRDLKKARTDGLINRLSEKQRRI